VTPENMRADQLLVGQEKMIYQKINKRSLAYPEGQDFIPPFYRQINQDCS
jgi:hypothetical protein